MGVSNKKIKLYRRSLTISKKILDKNTLSIAKSLREKSGFKSEDLLWLNKQNIEQKKLIINLLLKAKQTRVSFLEFWKQVVSSHTEFTYIINSDSAELFLAEVFFTGKVSKDTLENTNLTGVEWIDYERYENEQCLYLKISPSATPESIKEFLALPENKLGKLFDLKKNVYYKKLTVKSSAPETEKTKDIIRQLNKLSTEKLALLAQASSPEKFNDKFMSTGRLEHSRLKENLVSFILVHQYKKKEYSDGYIRSVPKTPKK